MITDADEYFKDLQSPFEHDKYVSCCRALYKYTEDLRVFRRAFGQHCNFKELLLKDIEKFKSMPDHPIVRFIICKLGTFCYQNERISILKFIQFSRKYKQAVEKEEERLFEPKDLQSTTEKKEEKKDKQEIIDIIENTTDHLYDAIDTIVEQLLALD